MSLDEGEGELTINDTTVKCLCTIVEVTGDSVLDQFQNFISSNTFFSIPFKPFFYLPLKFS